MLWLQQAFKKKPANKQSRGRSLYYYMNDFSTNNLIEQVQNDNKVELPYRYKVVLSLIPFGRENAKPIKNEAEKIGINSRDVNAIIRDLIIEYNIPIGSSSEKETKGYFIILDEHDKELAKKTLITRMSGTYKRLNKLDSIPIKQA